MTSHCLHAPPDTVANATPEATTSADSSETREVIHTTANHPWLSADHGWLLAGKLRVGKPVRLLDGGTSSVAAVQTLPCVGPMWNLALDDVLQDV